MTEKSTETAWWKEECHICGRCVGYVGAIQAGQFRSCIFCLEELEQIRKGSWKEWKEAQSPTQYPGPWRFRESLQAILRLGKESASVEVSPRSSVTRK